MTHHADKVVPAAATTESDVVMAAALALRADAARNRRH